MKGYFWSKQLTSNGEEYLIHDAKNDCIVAVLYDRSILETVLATLNK